MTKGLTTGLWKGNKVGRRGPTLSHLFFADDLVFIGKATLDNCAFLNYVLDFFCYRSGQKINQDKSKILFSKNVNQDRRKAICNILGFSQTESLGKYLGFSISSKKARKQDYAFIIDKVRNKLDGWKAKFFSLAGRNILVQSVFASIPNYYMQSCMLPISIHDQLNKISLDFLWGFDESNRKIHAISWYQVTIPKHLGGLIIRSSMEANLVAMAKSNWQLFTDKEKLCCKVLASKYDNGSRLGRLPTNGSLILRYIRKGNPPFLQGIKWIPVDGNDILFWFNYWASNYPLISKFYGPLLSNDVNLTLADVFPQGKLNLDIISQPLDENTLETIKAIPFSFSRLGGDSFAWKGSSNG
ncbi:hypothetical protein SLA2020_030250 [Shorea laevis]